MFEIKLDNEAQKNFEFLKDNSINMNNSVETYNIQNAFKLIFQLIEDIEKIKKASIE